MAGRTHLGLGTSFRSGRTDTLPPLGAGALSGRRGDACDQVTSSSSSCWSSESCLRDEFIRCALEPRPVDSEASKWVEGWGLCESSKFESCRAHNGLTSSALHSSQSSLPVSQDTGSNHSLPFT